jgi:maleylpyruvate isomerase
MSGMSDIAGRAAALTDADSRLLVLLDAGELDPAAPSLLPDWTVGHVLTHIARNADANRNLVRWAATGVVSPMYPGGTRDADIAAGAGRPSGELVADVRATAAALAADIAALPIDAWSVVIDTGRGGPVAADVVLSQRLAEVELHHHDLGMDRGLALLDPAAGAALLAAAVHSYGRTRVRSALRLEPDDAAPVGLGDVTDETTRVAGSSAALAGWLTGRTDGADLRCDGPLPDLPAW